MAFNIGEQVVCVRADNNPVWGPNGLVLGAIYTVSYVYPSTGIDVAGIEQLSPYGFHPNRFRKAPAQAAYTETSAELELT